MVALAVITIASVTWVFLASVSNAEAGRGFQFWRFK